MSSRNGTALVSPPRPDCGSSLLEVVGWVQLGSRFLIAAFMFCLITLPVARSL